VIRNTRISVRIVVNLHRKDANVDEMHDIWPHVNKKRIQWALDYYTRYPTRVDEGIER